jgi:hypothetical protein
MGRSRSSISSKDTELALALVNRGRRALNLKPLGRLPHGIPGKAQTCVLGRALSLRIYQDHDDRYFALLRHHVTAKRLAAAWRVEDPREAWDGWSVYLPKPLNGFVGDFDALRHPEYLNVAAAARIGFPSDLRHLKQGVRRFVKWSSDRHLSLSASCDDARNLCDASRSLCATSRTLCASGRTLCATSRKLCVASQAVISRSRTMTAHADQICFGRIAVDTILDRTAPAAIRSQRSEARSAGEYAIAS